MQNSKYSRMATMATFLTYATPLRRLRTPREAMCYQRSPACACVPQPVVVQTIAYGEALMDMHEPVPGASTANSELWTEYTGGAPFNLACALAKLDHAVSYVGAVGNDRRGDKLIEDLQNSGVYTDRVQRLDGHPTRGVFIRFDKGQPTFAGYSAEGAMCADAQRLDHSALTEELFKDADVFVTGTLGLASPGSADTQRHIAALAKATNTTILVDVNWRPVFWADSPMGIEGARDQIMAFLNENAVYVKVSVEDLAYLLNGEKVSDAAELLPIFGERCRGVLLTDGEYGMRYAFRDDNRVVKGGVDAFVVQGGAVDCVGAGDAFFAGFIAETFKRGGFEALCDVEVANKVCRFAAAVAHFVVAEKGAVGPQPSRMVVEKFLADIGAVRK